MSSIKHAFVVIAVFALFCGAVTSHAQSFVPDLVGAWVVKAEGGVILKGNVPGSKTHHVGEFSTLNAEAVVTKQQGRVLRGTFRSPKAIESFVAVIGPDNTSFHYADEDGIIEGKIVNKDTIEVIYRHVTASDTVIAVGTWTRKR